MDRPPTALESLYDLVDATTTVTRLRLSLRGTIDGVPDCNGRSYFLTGDEVWSSIITLEQVLQPMQAVCNFHAQQARRILDDGQTNTRAEYASSDYALHVRTLAGKLNMLGKSIDTICRGNEAAAYVRDEYEANMPKAIPNEDNLGDPFPDGIADDPTGDYFRNLYTLLSYAGNSIRSLYKLLLGFVKHLVEKYGPGCITHWRGTDLVKGSQASRHSYGGYYETTMTEPSVRVGLDYEDYPQTGWVEETNTGSGPDDEYYVHVGRPIDADSGRDDEDYQDSGFVEQTNTGSGPYDEDYVHAGRPIDADSGRDDEYYQRIGFDTGTGRDDEDHEHIRRRNRRREEVYEHARRVEETWFEWR